MNIYDVSQLRAGDWIIFQEPEDYGIIMEALEQAGYRWLSGDRLSSLNVSASVVGVCIDFGFHIGFASNYNDIYAHAHSRIYKSSELLMPDSSEFKPASRSELIKFLGVKQN